jgi:hypothetical protein
MRRPDMLKAMAARVTDLRAEFEAQLRAVSRIEQHLQKNHTVTDESWGALDDALRRSLGEMRVNNANIRDVLEELTREVRAEPRARA